MAMSGTPASAEILLLAMIADAVRILYWQNTENGHKGRKQPRSILDLIIGGRKDDGEGEGFDTAAAFEAWRAEMLREE